MRVIIASTIVPFVEGGGTFIVDWLDSMLRRRGHEVETLKLPFHSWYPEMLDQMLGLRLLDISNHGDRLITIRTPSYLLKHPNKVCWFIHHHRGAYDLWGTPAQDIPDTPEGRRYRRSLINADNAALREARHLYTNSRVVSARLKKYNDLDSEVLYPPLYEPERYHCGKFGDYIFYPSRLVPHKRQDLAIEAIAHTKTKVKLVIAGEPESENYLAHLTSLIKKYKVQRRVKLISSWISEAQKIDLFADCLAAIYIPEDEDSYGYPSLEAHAAGKPVLTTFDAGGTSELVEYGINGLLTSNDPADIAAAMDKLYEDRTLAEQMGAAGASRIDALGISWDHVISKLLQ